MDIIKLKEEHLEKEKAYQVEIEDQRENNELLEVKNFVYNNQIISKYRDPTIGNWLDFIVVTPSVEKTSNSANAIFISNLFNLNLSILI